MDHGGTVCSRAVTELRRGVPVQATGDRVTASVYPYPTRIGLRTRPPYRASQNPRGRSGIEVTGLSSDVRDAPAAQILIERGGVVEQLAHVRDAAGDPRTDVLIERVGVSEHVAHVRDTADVPRADVLIE